MNFIRLLTIGAALVSAGALLTVAACGGDDADEMAASGEAFDRAFIDAMVPHHESAIEMARVAMEAGLSQPGLVETARAAGRSSSSRPIASKELGCPASGMPRSRATCHTVS